MAHDFCRCVECDARLTAPESVASGLGPKCAARIGRQLYGNAAAVIECDLVPDGVCVRCGADLEIADGVREDCLYDAVCAYCYQVTR
jgi:hypothetical protein